MNWIDEKFQRPESGRLVILSGINENGKARVIRAFYAEKNAIEAENSDEWNCEYNEEKDEFYLKEGWYESNEFEENHWYVYLNDIHWQPLPKSHLENL